MIILTIVDGANQATLTLFDIVEKMIGCYVSDFIKSKKQVQCLGFNKKKKENNIENDSYLNHLHSGSYLIISKLKLKFRYMENPFEEDINNFQMNSDDIKCLMVT